MTCAEFHAFLESEPQPSIESAIGTPESSEHIARCLECRRFIDEQIEVARCLLLLRDSAPVIPASLDAAVLGAYRTQRMKPVRSAAPFFLENWNLPRATFRWAAVVMLAAIVSYGAIFVFIPHRRALKPAPLTEAPLATAQIPALASKPVAPVKGPLHKKRKFAPASVKATKPTSAMAEADEPLPTRFQGLMYCDPLSCPGAMDVIRVELPSPVLEYGGAGPKARGIVFADVLVGADGIARGIHVVE
jgi:hypothetical protein